MTRVHVRHLGGSRTHRSWPASRFGDRASRLGRLADCGLPVPDGFAIAPAASSVEGRWEDVESALDCHLARLEKRQGLLLGCPDRPLLLTARVSAQDAAAGLRPSVRCIGLTPQVADALRKRLGEDALKRMLGRFLEEFAVALLGVDPDDLADPLPGQTASEILSQSALAGWSEILNDGRLQLRTALRHLLRPRGDSGAFAPSDPCALLVQRLILTDAGDQAGIASVRLRSSSGQRRSVPKVSFRLHGEAEAVMESSLASSAAAFAAQSEETLLEATELLLAVEEGVPSVIDVRPMRLDPGGAAEVAVEWARAGLLSREEAVTRIDPQQLERLLHVRLGDVGDAVPVCRGIAAAPGVAVGRIAFAAGTAERMASRGVAPVLAKIETSPVDIGAMHVAAAMLTLRGGMTSHAAVVARGLGRPCITSLVDAALDSATGTLSVAGGAPLREGDMVTVDGSGGAVYVGALPTLPPQFGSAMEEILTWADGMRRLGVRANADTAEDASLARDYGADGVGLCRTEHMFFAQHRVTAMREVILADSVEERRQALDRLLPMQHGDFLEIFSRMRGRPVVVRLLDPPLHEFLPQEEGEIEELARAMGIAPRMVKDRAAALEEFNPMLGHRGCRVGIVYPEIYDMQCRAILEAACDDWEASDEPAVPEFMIPLVSAQREMEILRRRIDGVASEVRDRRGKCVRYTVGAMIETPRAALRAGAITRHAEFLSFGTNDLTQMTYGLSRDDAGRFMPDYLRKGVFDSDPFDSIDREGVGELIALAAKRGRKEDPSTVLGLCGEHGADPESIEYCEVLGIDYVSCSPFRVPVARLAAAQSALRVRAPDPD